MILICGLPNAGKTTYSKKYDDVIHLDTVKYKSVKDKFLRCIGVAKGKENPVIEGTYTTKFRRKQLLRFFKHEHNTCIFLDTPVDVCIERENNYRHRPISIILNHQDKLEVPTYDEGWDEIIVIR